MLKNRKYANCVNTKTEKLKFFDTTIEKPILKIVKTAKVKIPMPPPQIMVINSFVLRPFGSKADLNFFVFTDISWY